LNILPIIPYVEKIWPTVSKFGAGVIKKKLIFHEICQSLGVELHEDAFDFTYLQSLSIYLLDVEHQWGEVLQLEDVRKSFQKGYPASDWTEVARLLDHHLHTTIKSGPLKELDAVPADLLEGFVLVYRKQVSENLSPSAMENLRATNQISDKIEVGNSQILAAIENLKNQQTPSLENYVLRGEMEQLIDSEHQAQLDQIKKAFDNHQVSVARANLVDFKERIWEKTTDNIRFKVLNNIGYSFMLLDDFEGAIPYYEQAAAINPEHAANLSALAGLYLILKRFEDAKPLTEKLAESHPALKVSLELYQIPEVELPEDLETLVPQNLLDDPELLVALINVSNKRFPKTALKYARRLYELKPESDNYIDIYCNIVCVAVVGEHIDFQTTELLSDEDHAHLQLAKQLFEQRREKLKNTGERELQIHLLEKHNLVLTVLGDQEAALKIADHLLTIEPGNYYGNKQSGINLMFLHRYEDAEKRFAQIGSDHPQLWEFHTSWLLALGKMKRMDEAKVIANKLLDKTETPDADRQRILNTMAFLYYSENQQYPEAMGYILQTEKINPGSLGMLSDKAKILRALNQNGEVEKVEQRMLALSNSDLEPQHVRDRYFAAVYFMQYGKPKVAANLLESIAEPSRNHLLTYQLIEAWMRSGQKAKALPVCVDLRERFGLNPEYTIKEVEIYYHYHDYVQAEKILTEFVAAFPDDLTAQLNLAGLYHRNRNFKALREFCNADLSRFNFRSDQLWGYVELLRSAGQYERCLELLYQHRRANPSYEANQLFVNFCLADPEERKHTEIPAKAGKNCAVTLVSGGLTFCYVIIDKPTDQLKTNEGEINLQHPIYRILKGKKIGQRVALHEHQDARWEITKILPLYTHVFQNAMHQNTTIYAAQSGYISGEVNEPADIDKFMGQHLEKYERFQAMMQEQEKNYEAYLLPLSAYAIFNKTSPINVYEHFSRRCGIRSTIGNVDLYNQAVASATGATAFVPDITALLTLFRIGFTRPGGFPKFIIPHTTSDMIYNHIGEKGLRAHTDEISVGLHNGQKVRYLVTAAERQAEVARLKVFQNWINQHCEVRPCKILLDYDSQKWHRFKQAIGVDVFESALLSLETGAVFLCDDHATRRMFEEETQVKGVWTQATICSLANKNLISRDQAYDYYLDLIRLGHRHTTVDKDMVEYTLRKDDYRIGPAVSAAVDILSGYYSDENSLQIVFAIISDLSKQLLPLSQFEQLTYYLFMRFLSGRMVFPLCARFYRLSDYYITDPQLSLIVKHAILQLINDHNFPAPKTTRDLVLQQNN